MIWNCCPLFNELTLLRIQVEETRGLPIRHITVESNWTFSGKPKPYYSQGLTDLPEIEATVIGWSQADSNPWVNEKKQRDAILTTLNLVGMKDDDMVIIRDADEVVSRKAIEAFKPEMECAFLEMKKYDYFLNVYEGQWNIAKIMTGKYLRERSPEEVRNSGAPHSIPLSGWHWSFLGGVDTVLEKFASFSHQEEAVQRHANREELIRKMAIGESIWSNDKWEVVPISSDFPQYVQDHQYNSLSHLIFHP